MWVVLVLICIVLTLVFLQDALTSEIEFTNTPESERGWELLEERLRGPTQVNEVVIVRSETLTVDDSRFEAFIRDLFADIARLQPDIVEGGLHYYMFRDEDLVSADRHITILPLVMAGDYHDAYDNIGEVHDVISERQHEGFDVLITGAATLNEDFGKVAEKDLVTGEIIGVPVALLVLVLVFGAVAAAILPTVLAGVSIAVAIGLTAVVGQGFELSYFVVNMVTMMGLAVGIDYSLFIVSRYREERSRGLDRMEAIAVAGGTASRTAFVSGVTVIFALVGMLFVPLSLFHSLAAGAILVVAVVVAAALTLLPAILALMGDLVNAWRLPIIQRAGRPDAVGAPHGFWDRLTRIVMRRPAIGIVVTATLLLAAASPLLDIEIGAAGVTTLPERVQSKQGFAILDREFGGGRTEPVEIVIVGEVGSEAVRESMRELISRVRSDDAFGTLLTQEPEVSPSGDLALISVALTGDALADLALDFVKRVRDDYAPAAFSETGASVYVTGTTAFNVDYLAQTAEYMPVVMAFVLSMSFLLLTLVFRSLIVPVKAILMNLLSVGAAYGLIVLIFQKGVGAGVLGFQQVDDVEAWVPLFLFAVLFGLSMDYHVFLLSRIREHFDRTGDNTESVAFGLRTTGRIITGAALIMVAVFLGFAQGELVMFQQMGFGLGVAILLDATIIRSVLVPSSMKLLGRWNWYFPSWLKWLPEMRVEK